MKPPTPGPTPPPLAESNFLSVSKLAASDGDADDAFGASVSISGDRVVVGAFTDEHAGFGSGSAYVFQRDENGTALDPTDDFWIQQGKLTASDAAASDFFGSSVSISVYSVIVGAWGNDDAGTVSGSAYVFYALLCGNGVHDGAEECDDCGESATCDIDCTFAECGDGTVNVTAGEECDGGLTCTDCLCDADFEPTAPPSLDCQPTCGNGRIDPGEECDDGNPDNGDGCSSTCMVEAGWDCTGEPSVCTRTAIPTVSEWGLIVLTLLLLTGAKVHFARKRGSCHG